MTVGAARLLTIGLGLALAGCSGGSGAGLPPAPSEPVLADVQSRIFTPRCATSGCHVTGTAAFDMVLSAGLSAQNILGVPSGQNGNFLRVAPGDSADSYLYMKVTADARIGGDPMPNLGGPLRQSDLDLLRDWIDQGAR